MAHRKLKGKSIIYYVTEANYSECLYMLKESDMFQFGPLFRVHQSSNQIRANGEY